MSDVTGRSCWKVGELARLSGVTVRALHHYEAKGLLVPSARAPSGHRLYDEADVQRLYRIVALRELGLSLQHIETVLDGRLDLADLLADHLAHVEARLAALRALRARLAGLVAVVHAAGPPATADLLGLIEGTTKMNETVKRYFTAEQLSSLEERRGLLGDDAIAAVQDEWPRLIAQVKERMDGGVDPADPDVQALAARWMQLLEAFHGGDPGLRDSLYRMGTEEGAQLRATYGTGYPTPEMMEYIAEASAAS